MARVTGRRVGLSPARRAIVELMRLSAGVPLVTVERSMDLRRLAEARAATPSPPSWAALFAKAFAVVAATRPELRRSYHRWPTAHIYEADDSIGSVAVAREHAGEPCVFFGLLRTPDRQTLAGLDAALTNFKTMPVTEVRHFRRVLKYAALPWPLRPLAWRWGYERSGQSRARDFGTFGVTTTAGLGATLESLVSPVGVTLTYGPVVNGVVSVRLTFDHRVLDGAPAAQALAALEETLTGEISDEVERGSN